MPPLRPLRMSSGAVRTSGSSWGGVEEEEEEGGWIEWTRLSGTLSGSLILVVLFLYLQGVRGTVALASFSSL
jgi:hypothetical protein